ncbi:hypothetical protein OPT61_g2029 [Boeremia exigua]|uniref:Uncharacterized protein n=1 Tax=Boeremia exigua TaxID=749465 RepID=A0ACC2IN06_9PLEO|nr:hypothetical protein OPT61_g2029 [Boeremia exigua]
MTIDKIEAAREQTQSAEEEDQGQNRPRTAGPNSLIDQRVSPILLYSHRKMNRTLSRESKNVQKVPAQQCVGGMKKTRL